MADAEAAKIKDELAFERSIKDSFPANRHVIKIVPIDIARGIGRKIIVTNTRDEIDNARARIILTSSRRYDVMTGWGDADCGFTFRLGGQYLVYAYGGNGKTLQTSICTRTRLTVRCYR